jgi:hypothetical protein
MLTIAGPVTLSAGPPTQSSEEAEMNQNVGTIDRVVRIVAGVALIAIVFVGPQTPWGWIGIVPLATALLGWCPAYTLFGLSTCPVKKTQA